MHRLFSRGRLLATTSALAMTAVTGGAALACNPSIVVNGPGSVGGITNSGNIECVDVGDRTVVDGNITNEATGTIGGGAPPPETGISLHNATINGAIVNSGVIPARAAAIKVPGASTVTRGIPNGTGGTPKGPGAD